MTIDIRIATFIFMTCSLLMNITTLCWLMCERHAALSVMHQAHDRQTCYGVVGELNTSMWADGDTLYLTTDGGVTYRAVLYNKEVTP